MAKEKSNLEEDIEKAGKRIEETAKHGEAIDHYVKYAYYNYVQEQGIHRKEYPYTFTEKQKDELIDKVLGRLKEHFIYMNKSDKKALEGLPEHVWQDAILPTYFGVSRGILKEHWKDKKRITPNDMHGIVQNAGRALKDSLYKSLTSLGPESFEAGKEHLQELENKYKFGIKLKNIREPKSLYNALIEAHYAKREKDLIEKEDLAEKSEPYERKIAA